MKMNKLLQAGSKYWLGDVKWQEEIHDGKCIGDIRPGVDRGRGEINV